MGRDTIIVREYLESLSEQNELDKLFPILLELMGFRIVATADESRGQSQYGKDIIAMGPDEDGTQKRFYFELKGHSDRNINDSVWMKKDGIRDSLIAALDAEFNDSSIPGFNDLPIKIVLVHNGVLQFNTRPTIEGFVRKNFNNGREFDRWDIHKLTELFSEYLFSEHLLTDKENIQLFKRTLVLLDNPEYELEDLKRLVSNLLQTSPDPTSRDFEKLFATINLLSHILFEYSRQCNNLVPAKNGIAFMVLQTWAWIIRNGHEKRKKVLTKFRMLLELHYRVLQEYFEKTLPSVVEKDGLFALNGGFFEEIGNPLRSFEYISDLVYFYLLRPYYPRFKASYTEQKAVRIEAIQKKTLLTILQNNPACSRPLIDRHYVPIALIIIFFFGSKNLTDDESHAMTQYIADCYSEIKAIQTIHKRLPEAGNNIEALISFVATKTRPEDYTDDCSILILVLLELCTIVNNQDVYEHIKDSLISHDKLVRIFPPDDADFEEQYFLGNVNHLMENEFNLSIPEKLEDFKTKIIANKDVSIPFKSDSAGFTFLKLLPAIVYHNDLLRDEWTKVLPPPCK